MVKLRLPSLRVGNVNRSDWVGQEREGYVSIYGSRCRKSNGIMVVARHQQQYTYKIFLSPQHEPVLFHSILINRHHQQETVEETSMRHRFSSQESARSDILDVSERSRINRSFPTSLYSVNAVWRTVGGPAVAVVLVVDLSSWWRDERDGGFTMRYVR